MAGIWIYIVSWTLTFNGFEYGKIEGSFEKKFLNRSEAVAFMEGPRPVRKCYERIENVKLDSTFIDTSTVEMGAACDSVKRWQRFGEEGGIIYFGERQYRLRSQPNWNGKPVENIKD